MINVDVLDTLLDSLEAETEILVVNPMQPNVRLPIGKIVIEYDFETDKDKVLLVTETPKA